jgi:hypothetical protein
VKVSYLLSHENRKHHPTLIFFLQFFVKSLTFNRANKSDVCWGKLRKSRETIGEVAQSRLTAINSLYLKKKSVDPVLQIQLMTAEKN